MLQEQTSRPHSARGCGDSLFTLYFLEGACVCTFHGPAPHCFHNTHGTWDPLQWAGCLPCATTVLSTFIHHLFIRVHSKANLEAEIWDASSLVGRRSSNYLWRMGKSGSKGEKPTKDGVKNSLLQQLGLVPTGGLWKTKCNQTEGCPPSRGEKCGVVLCLIESCSGDINSLAFLASLFPALPASREHHHTETQNAPAPGR